ncbi:alpha-(1,3)-fucosyltransferase C-like [Rhipicephalus sanguineus]|uniref:alpha-(1,3)-fucosyltransferase C-like n=1 Tax=Rhipicephalus sanguineus TaxID=34632 RepID=UPI001892EF31|nr:alpha-(1,3)-fucosyltransferase C-like [Rhipicephalus sanguineus]
MPCATSKCFWVVAVAVPVVLLTLGTLYMIYVPHTTTQPLSYWYPWRQRPPSVGYAFPRIFLWNPVDGDRCPRVQDRLMMECGEFNTTKKHCYITKDPIYHVVSDAIVVEASRLDPYKLPRRRHQEQRWVYSTLAGEPTNSSLALTLVSGMFNWTMSHRDDADVVVPYVKWQKRSHFIPMPREFLLEAIDAKTKSVAWFVSTCEEPLRHNVESIRYHPLPRSSENFMAHVNQTFDVFMFSDCGRPLCNSIDDCVQMAAKDFYFVFVLETSPCFHHPMEMISAAFKYNIVPIYFGKTALGDSVPQGSVYDTSQEPTAFDIVDKLNVMRDDVDTYLSYFAWKEKLYQFQEHPMCALCDALYASAAGSSATTDILSWWRRRPECDYVIPSPGGPIINTKLTPYGIYFVPAEHADIPGRVIRPPKARHPNTSTTTLASTTISTQMPLPLEVNEDLGHDHDDIL